MKKGTKESPAFKIVITAIVTVTLVLVALLLFRNFKYVPSATNKINKNAKKYQVMSEKYNAGLFKDLTKEIDKETIAINILKETQGTNHKETLDTLTGAENDLAKAIKDSEESVNKNVDEAEKAINDNVDEAEAAINDNVDYTRHSINTNIMMTAYMTNYSIANARSSIEQAISSSESSIKNRIKKAEDEIKGKVNGIEGSLGAKINGVKQEVIHTGQTLSTKLNDIETAQTTRFNDVDSKLETLETGETDLSTLVSTKASEIQTTLSTISGKVDDVSTQITTAESAAETAMGNVTTSINDLTTAVAGNTTAIETVNGSVTALSTVLGTATDATDATTLFGKTNLVISKLEGLETTLGDINTGVTNANTKLDALQTAVAGIQTVKPITDSVITQAYNNSGYGNTQTRITNAINWLISNGYARN